MVSFIDGGNGVAGETHRPVASHLQKLYHIMLCRVHFVWAGFELVVSDNNWKETKVNIRLTKNTSTTSNLTKKKWRSYIKFTTFSTTCQKYNAVGKSFSLMSLIIQ